MVEACEWNSFSKTLSSCSHKLRLSSSCLYVIEAGVTFDAAVDTVTAVDELELVANAEAPKIELEDGKDVVADDETTGAANENELEVGAVLVACDREVEVVVPDNILDEALVALVDREDDKGALVALVVEVSAVEADDKPKPAALAVDDDGVKENPVDALVAAVDATIALGPNENPLDGAEVVAAVV